MNVRVTPVDLPLARAFATSRNISATSRSYFLEADGAVGEATPVRFYGELPLMLEEALRYLLARLPDWRDPREAWPELDRALGYNSGAKCGIDLLLWDHLGFSQKATVRELLGIDAEGPMRTALSVGIGTPEEMRAEVQNHPGFSIYKLKVGFDGDLDAVDAVHEITGAPLYVDANGGWTVDEACRKLPQLLSKGVVVCEQPIFSGRREDWQRVRGAAGIPVIVDEYCRTAADVQHWSGWVDGVNVKLQKAGGITPAWNMIRRAREEGMKVMIGCMLESSVGIAAAAQLGPLADYLDLDSHLLLARDPYEGIPAIDGALVPSGAPGLGVRPRQETLKTA
jgi:L-alanine-DL-glutamate epimerase-like enolase superfamily enzyme